MGDDWSIKDWLDTPRHRRVIGLSALGLGGVVDLGLVDWPTWMGAIIVGLCVLGFGLGLLGELRHHGSSQRIQVGAVSLVLLFLGGLSAWGIYRHAEGDARTDRIADDARVAREEARQAHEEAAQAHIGIDRLRARIDAVTDAQRRVNATAQSIADSIGAGQCLAPFNLGWKLFLTDGNELLSQSAAVSGVDPRFYLDWTTVKIVSSTGNTTTIGLPRSTWNGAVIDGLAIKLYDTLCDPQYAVTMGGTSMQLGGSVIDVDGKETLFAIGARGTLQ